MILVKSSLNGCIYQMLVLGILFPLGIKPILTLSLLHRNLPKLSSCWEGGGSIFLPRLEMGKTQESGSHEATDEWKPLIQQGVSCWCKLRKWPLLWAASGGCDEETKLCESPRGSSLSGGTKLGLWEVWEASSKTWGWPVRGNCEGSFVRGSVWEKLTLGVAVGPQSVLSHCSSLRRMECAGGMQLYKCPLCSENYLTYSSCLVSLNLTWC